MINCGALSEEAREYITRIETENNKYKTENQVYKTRIIDFEQKKTELEQKKNEAEQKAVFVEKRNQVLEAENARLLEELKLALYRKFGRLAEKIYDKNQPSLFDEEQGADGGQQSDEEDEKIAVASHQRKKGRKPIDSSIPRVERRIDIPEEDKQCACGNPLVQIGEETYERIIMIPQQIYVEKIIMPKYACKNCEGSGDEDKPAVRVAAVPENIMPGSIATPSLLASIFTNKFCDHLPFYRQEAAFERIGITISRQNMSNWQRKVCDKLEPLSKLMKAHLRRGVVMRMDETTMRVMREGGRANTQKSYMWLALGGPPDAPVVIYEYHPTRAADNINSFLTGFSGHLQTDGYEGYDSALASRPDIIHVGCMTHARRKFFEAHKVSKSETARIAISKIKGLYTIESTLREELKQNKITADKFLEMRREKASALLEEFHLWLEARALELRDSSKTAGAVSYTLKQWSKLICYLDSVELTPDNNASERLIRPFVIGRKNWMLSGSPDGAASSCALYSIIESAKLNNVNPYNYLNRIFTLAATMTPCDDWSPLLPWNIKL